MAMGEHHGMEVLDRLGLRSACTCPDCGGARWKFDAEVVLRFRCHAGLGFLVQCLPGGQAEHQERALWKAIRALDELRELRLRMSRRSEHGCHPQFWKRFMTRAEAHRRAAGILRGMVKRERPPSPAQPVTSRSSLDSERLGTGRTVETI
jgi:two-component system chemotaxis response regulator CheB